MAAAPSTTDLITVRIVDPIAGDFSWIPPDQMQQDLQEALASKRFKDASEMQAHIDELAIIVLSSIGLYASQLRLTMNQRAESQQPSKEAFVLWPREHDKTDATGANDLSDVDPIEAERLMADNNGQ